MVAAYLGLLTLLAIERMVELRISRRNAGWALASGGIEVGQRHFTFMKLLHGAFLISCALEVTALDRPFRPAIGLPALAAALLAQALRYWAVRSLGRRWNVRVIALPGAPVVARGPYRFVRHPNYLAVVVEGLAVPLIHSAWITAGVFTLLNALLLAVRIRSEERALALHCDYDEQMGSKPRLLPWAPRARSR